MKCPKCDQPMLPKGTAKREDHFDHANGCPLSYGMVSLEAQLIEARARIAEMEENAIEQMVFLRQECARVAHEKSGDVNVGHEVGRIDLLPFVHALRREPKDSGNGEPDTRAHP